MSGSTEEEARWWAEKKRRLEVMVVGFAGVPVTGVAIVILGLPWLWWCLGFGAGVTGLAMVANWKHTAPKDPKQLPPARLE